ncbi:hypothetical protein ACHHYP_16281 [Achlya hypogyna]|uniref:Phosphatidate cytidylyltransferase n=1 Tax=Achlya hypogyna TaxID=1202772 RepID=A0A1V9ZE53_ACHHY|nr:hypothetical protein ACHHYP_16281 [Achlya hypogyna]
MRSVQDENEKAKPFYLIVPLTPTSDEPSTGRSQTVARTILSHCPKARLSALQLGVTLTFFLTFEASQTYLWDGSAPFFATTILLLCSYEFFWLAHHSTRALTAELDPDQPSDGSVRCGQVFADLFFGGRLHGLAATAAAFAGGVYYICSVYGIQALTSASGIEYHRTITALGTFAGVGSAYLSVFCPTWAAGLSLLCFGSFFVFVSIDAIAFQQSVLTHQFVIDSGELYAQGGSLVIALMLFRPVLPLVSLVLICHHLVGFMFVFGCCSAISGYIEHLDQDAAVNLLLGVLWVSIGASLTQFMWHRLVEKARQSWYGNVRLVPCLVDDSPLLYEVGLSSFGGMLGMLFASFYADIVGSWTAKLVYSGIAVALANFGRPFIAVIRTVGGDANVDDPHGLFGTHGGLLDGLQLFLPLIMAFSPYYRVHIGNHEVTPPGAVPA